MYSSSSYAPSSQTQSSSRSQSTHSGSSRWASYDGASSASEPAQLTQPAPAAPAAAAAPDGLVVKHENLDIELKELIQRFDRDGDGDIDLNELLAAMQELQNEKKSNARLWKILIVGAILFALTLGAVFALSVAAAALIKDTSVNNSGSQPAVMTAKGGSGDAFQNTVRTAPITPGTSVAPTDIADSSASSRSALAARAARDGVAVRALDSEDDIGYECTVLDLESADTHTFEATFSFVKTSVFDAVMADPSVPFTLAVPGNDGLDDILRFNVNVRGKLATTATELNNELAVLELSDVDDSDGLARVCCSLSTCVYAVGDLNDEDTDPDALVYSTFSNGTTAVASAAASARAATARAAAADAFTPGMSTRVPHTNPVCMKFKCNLVSPSLLSPVSAAYRVDKPRSRSRSRSAIKPYELHTASSPARAMVCPTNAPVLIKAGSAWEVAASSPNAHLISDLRTSAKIDSTLIGNLETSLASYTGSCPDGKLPAMYRYVINTVVDVHWTEAGSPKSASIAFKQFDESTPVAECRCYTDPAAPSPPPPPPPRTRGGRSSRGGGSSRGGRRC